MNTYYHIIGEHIKVNHGPVILQLWGDTEDTHILEALSTGIRNRGIDCLGVLMAKEKIHEYIKQGQLTPEHVYKGFDFSKKFTTIDICKFSPTGLAGAFTDEERPVFLQFMGQVFHMFTRQGNDFLQIRIPSERNALETGMTYDDYEEAWKKLIDVDYDAIDGLMDQQLTTYTNQSSYKLITHSLDGVAHSLTFDTCGRGWHKDNGNGDFPVGEIYIAPVETSVHGEYVATKLFWEDEILENVVLTIEKGQLVKSSAPRILEDLKEAPGDALMVGEFGIGMNSGLETLTGYSLFDEKLKGTCHIALGMNTMFGGHNETPVHIDFVNDRYSIQPVTLHL